MTPPIYLLVLATSYTESWYQLSEEEQNALWAKVNEIDRRAGGEWVLRCDSRWADESVIGWGILKYPSMDAYLQKVADLEKLNWWRYFSSKTILGTETDLVPESPG